MAAALIVIVAFIVVGVLAATRGADSRPTGAQRPLPQWPFHPYRG